MPMTSMIPLDELIMSPRVQSSIRFYSYNINPEDKSDLIQDYYLAIVKSYKNIADPSRAEAFCIEVIKRQTYKYFAKKKVRNGVVMLMSPVNDDDGEEMEVLEYGQEDMCYPLAELRANYLKIRNCFTKSEASILDAIIIDNAYSLGMYGEVQTIATDFGVTKAHVTQTIKKLRGYLS